MSITYQCWNSFSWYNNSTMCLPPSLRLFQTKPIRVNKEQKRREKLFSLSGREIYGIAFVVLYFRPSLILLCYVVLDVSTLGLLTERGDIEKEMCYKMIFNYSKFGCSSLGLIDEWRREINLFHLLRSDRRSFGKSSRMNERQPNLPDIPHDCAFKTKSKRK